MAAIVRHRSSEGGAENLDSRRAPDFAEPIRAWRAWWVLLQGQKLRLRSLFYPLLWEPGRRVEAECLHWRLLRPWRRRAHQAPRERCDCGIYAATAPSTAVEYLGPMQPAPPAEAVEYAVGPVSLWGMVIECGRGWRASYAYPATLYLPTQSLGRSRLTPRELVDGLAGYRVPVTLIDASDPSQLVEEIVRGGLVAEKDERRKAKEDLPGRAGRGSGAEGATTGARAVQAAAPAEAPSKPVKLPTR